MPASQAGRLASSAKDPDLPVHKSQVAMTGTSREFESEVLSVAPIMGDAVLLTVSAPPSVVVHLRPGQFFNIVTRSTGSFDPLLRRPYSVYRADVAASSLTFL